MIFIISHFAKRLTFIVEARQSLQHSIVNCCANKGIFAFIEEMKISISGQLKKEFERRRPV